MIYSNIQKGIFLSRPNRFIAQVEMDGRVETCHVKNTGRCRELLIPGTKVLLQEQNAKMRKTKYDLISVYKGDRLINMDSQAPNGAVASWLKAGNLFKDITLLKPECRFENSRFDFYVETPTERAFIEVKGVTLEKDGVVMFPDAPTQRGRRHLVELGRCREFGFGAYLIFVIQMRGVRYFVPNWETDPDFARALMEAKAKGVEILAFDCEVEKDRMKIGDPVPIRLKN